MNEKTKNILNILLDILIVIFMLFAVLVLVVSLSQKSGNVSHLFGYTVRSVQTESMEQYDDDGNRVYDNGAFFKGDMIVLEISDRDSYEVGETVMFYMPIQRRLNKFWEECSPDTADENILVTHRIVEIVEENGITYYRTKGINDAKNPDPDKNLKEASEIIAVYNGTRINGLGKAIDFVQSSTGFLVCIILPIAIFVIIQAIRVIRNLIAYKAQKLATEGPSVSELSEEEKRRIAEEYLKQQQAAEDDTASSTAKAADDE